MKTQNTETQQHTPGPWTAKHAEYADADAFEIRANDGARIAEVSISQVLFRQKAAANARLIASAPTMHAECRTVSAMLRGLAVNNSAIESQLHALAERLYNVTLT